MTDGRRHSQARPVPDPREKQTFWTRWGAIGTWAGTIVAITGIAVVIAAGSDNTEQTVRPEPDPPPTEISTDFEEDCFDSENQSSSCGAYRAWFKVSADPCDAQGATQALGLDSTVVELLVDTRIYNGICLVRPGEAALSAGAGISDLRSLQAKQPLDPRLVACWNTTNLNAPIPCNSPHTFESVTAWQPVPDSPTLDAKCRSAAAGYVGDQVDVHGKPLLSRVAHAEIDGIPKYRCLVVSDQALTGSVYHLGGRPLPIKT